MRTLWHSKQAPDINAILLAALQQVTNDDDRLDTATMFISAELNAWICRNGTIVVTRLYSLPVVIDPALYGISAEVRYDPPKETDSGTGQKTG